jgi:hypothetical protein
MYASEEAWQPQGCAVELPLRFVWGASMRKIFSCSCVKIKQSGVVVMKCYICFKFKIHDVFIQYILDLFFYIDFMGHERKKLEN